MRRRVGVRAGMLVHRRLRAPEMAAQQAARACRRRPQASSAYMARRPLPTPRANPSDLTSPGRRFARRNRGVSMLGVVVPAHNEEDHIGDCLEALRIASRCPRLNGEKVLIVVALDACSDQTERIARSWGAATIAVDARNVGIARGRGA